MTDVPGRGNRQWQATGSAKAPRQKHGCHVQTLPGDQTVWCRVSGGELGCKLRVEVRARPCSCLEALVGILDFALYKMESQERKHDLI